MQHERDESDSALLIIRAGASINDPSSEPIVVELEQMIDEQIDRVVIDCSGTDYFNSLALSVLMRIRNRLKAKSGRIRLCGTSRQIEQLLEMTSLSPHLPRSDTLDAARVDVAS